MRLNDFLEGWKFFMGAFRHIGHLHDDDMEAYYVALKRAKIPPDLWIATAQEYSSRASTYEHPPVPDEVIDDCRAFREKQRLRSQPPFCSLCNGRRLLPVHILYVKVSRQDGKSEIRRFVLPICQNWAENVEWLQHIPAGAIISWSLGAHNTVPCDCRRGLGAYKTYSDYIPNRPPRSDDWANEATSRETLYAALQSLWPGREQYYVPPLAREDANRAEAGHREEADYD